MSDLRKFVANLNTTQCMSMHMDYVAFEKNGYLDDPSELRTQVGLFLNMHDNQTPYFTLWVEKMMFEVYRKYSVYSLE